jgi:hypothetical protein
MPRVPNLLHELPDRKGKWADLLHSAGLEEHHTDAIHRLLHRKFHEYRGGGVVEEEMAWLEDHLLSFYGHSLTAEQKEYFREHLELMMREE